MNTQRIGESIPIGGIGLLPATAAPPPPATGGDNAIRLAPPGRLTMGVAAPGSVILGPAYGRFHAGNLSVQ